MPKRRKMNRGIWRHKSVSDRLKGWNRERADTSARLQGVWKESAGCTEQREEETGC